MAHKVDEIIKKNIHTANSIVNKAYEIVSASPVIDDILGGGIKVGSFGLVTGVYKGGKTSVCLHIAKKFILAGYKVYYASVEHRLTDRDLKTHNIPNDPNQFQIIMSAQGSILSGEDFLRVLRAKIDSEQNCLFIIDSFSALCSDELFDGDIGDRFRDPMPLKLSAFCKVIAAPLSINNNTVIGITHEIANQTTVPGAKTKVETSGVKIQYQADFKLRVSHATPILNNGKQVGQLIHWKCLTSPLGPPNRTGDSRFLYASGVDEVAELVDLCTLTGVITKAGSWLKYGEISLQGAERFAQHLHNTPDTVTELKQRLALVS